MAIPEFTALFLGLVILLPTIASITKFDQWWIRVYDFPRLQISFLILVVFLYSVFVYALDQVWHFVMLTFLALSFLYQSIKIFPYTFFAKKQVIKYNNDNLRSEVSILVSNVLMTNTNYDKLIRLVAMKDPDILLTLETDKQWEEELSVLEKDYPHTVKIPKDNLYGMHLYSKLELEDISIKHLITEEIPSIHGRVRLRSGELIKIHCLHPKPPSPTEDLNSTNRDAELLLVGKEVKDNEESTLVFGDLNDVAWSRTTRLFQSISGLLDPRIGRGFYNTYHTGYPVFRWPLDHVFHTTDFSLIDLKRLPSIGSDHFPIFIALNHEPRFEDLHEKPETADAEEEEWADEKIDKGNPTEREL